MAIEAVVVLTIRVVVFLSSSRTDQIRVKAFLQGAHQADAVEIISDSTTVIDLSNHIPNSIPIYIFTPVVQEIPQGAERHLQVRVIEFIPNIEAKRTIFTSFLKESMEKC
jgi:hypothetical protein